MTPSSIPVSDSASMEENNYSKKELGDIEVKAELKDFCQMAALITQSKGAILGLFHHKSRILKYQYGFNNEISDQFFRYSEQIAKAGQFVEIPDVINQKDASFIKFLHDQPNLRYFACQPLIDSGQKLIGFVSVLSNEVKQLNVHQKTALKVLSRQIVATIDLDRKIKESESENYQLKIAIEESTAQVQEVSSLLDHVVDLVPHPIFIKDSESRYIFGNAAQLQLLNTTRASIMGRHDADFITVKDQLAEIEHTDQEVLKNGSMVNIAEQQITVGEVTKFLKTFKVPYLNSITKDQNILGISIDITEVKQAEVALKESEENYTKLIENSPDGYLIHEEGTIKYINKKAAEFVGIDNPQELIGTSIYNFIDIASLSDVSESLGQLNSGTAVLPLTEIQIIAGNGKTVEVETLGLPIKYKGRQAIQTLLRDITERKNYLEALHKREQEFETLAENSQDIIARLNRDSSITYINGAGEKSIGVSREDIIGNTYRQLGFPDDVCKRLEDKIKLLFDLAKPVSGYYELETESNIKYNQILLVPEFDNKGNVVSAMASVRDVSDLKYAEKHLIEANKELSTLIYRASHDLKGPLLSIKGLAMLGVVGIEDTPTEIFNRIIDISFKFEETLKNLTSVASIKEKETRFEELDVSVLIEGITQEGKKSVEQEFHLTTDITLRIIYTDKELFTSILKNLIFNAAIFSREKTAGAIKVSVKETNNGIFINVKDNGIGIEDRIKPKIFDMFYRGNVRSGGSGMGLFVVNQAVKKLKGKISFTSKINEGTDFEIFLPFY